VAFPSCIMPHTTVRIPRCRHCPHPAKASHHLASAGVEKQPSSQQAQTSGSPRPHVTCPQPFPFTLGSIVELGRGDLRQRWTDVGVGERRSCRTGQPNQHPLPNHSKHQRLHKVTAAPISLIQNKLFHQPYWAGPTLSMEVSILFLTAY